MEEQTKQQPSPSKRTRLIYNGAMILMGIILALLLFNYCQGKPAPSAVGVVLKKQYDSLQGTYSNLLKSVAKIDADLKQKEVELTASKAEQQKALLNYAKMYSTGREAIINNPCNDSLHLAAYDSLNASCKVVQARDSNVIGQYRYLVGALQEKVLKKDSIITNRNAVIWLDGISIALCRDSLVEAKRNGRRGKIKAFFLGMGVGATLREAGGAIIKAVK